MNKAPAVGFALIVRMECDIIGFPIRGYRAMPRAVPTVLHRQRGKGLLLPLIRIQQIPAGKFKNSHTVMIRPSAGGGVNHPQLSVLDMVASIFSHSYSGVDIMTREEDTVHGSFIFAM